MFFSGDINEVLLRVAAFFVGSFDGQSAELRAIIWFIASLH